MNIVNSDIPLSVGAWLLNDDYDYNPDPTVISATSLLTPLKKFILGTRVPEADQTLDMQQILNSRIGTAVHDSIERVWLTERYKEALKKLGYPSKVIKKVLVNPTKDELYKGCIPVYLEIRSHKKVGKFTVSGKFDFIGDGRVEDNKYTSVSSAIYDSKDEDYINQLSIYRWLNPDLITRNQGLINFFFKDWNRKDAQRIPNYPPAQCHSQTYPLKSIPEIDRFIRNKLELISQYWDEPEENIPECSEDDLWKRPDIYKYFSKETNKRATATFTDYAEAQAKVNVKGGVIKIVRGTVNACRYCNAAPICKQKNKYLANGSLTLD